MTTPQLMLLGVHRKGKGSFPAEILQDGFWETPPQSQAPAGCVMVSFLLPRRPHQQLKHHRFTDLQLWRPEIQVQPQQLKPRRWQDGLRPGASRESLLPILLRGSLGLWDPGPCFPAGCRLRASRGAGGVF